MISTKINAADLAGKGVVGLPDTPGLSAADMQAKFDEIALEVLVPKHNALIDALAGADGAAGIGAGSGTVAGHLDNRANPHAVTAAQVGAYSRAETDGRIAAAAAIYDANNSGVVDDSEKLSGHPASYFAPASHAAATAVYGAASATNYGHTRVINAVTSESATDAASAGAVKLAYDTAAAALGAAGGGTAQNACQLLWSGTVQMYGIITVPQVADYTLFLISFNGNMGLACRRSDTAMTLFGGYGDYTSYTTIGGEIAITGTTLRVDMLKKIQHNASGSHNSAQDLSITSLWGIA